MLDHIVGIDKAVTASIIELFPRNIVLDWLFSFLSVQGLTVVVWLLVLFLYVSWEEYHHRRFTLYFLLSFGITSFLTNIVYKNLYMRARPWMLWELAQNGCPDTSSFPSAHAAGAFAGAVIFAHFDPKRKYIYYVIAGLIAFSRIYLYCHFLLDIVAGGLIGYGIGKILLISLKKKRNKKSLKNI